MMPVQVNTVRGPVSSSDLGMTLTHEHFIVDWTARMAAPDQDDARVLYDSRVNPSLNWLLTENPSCCLDNARLDDVPGMIAELKNFVGAGGRTVVECSNGDIGRDPLALRDISEQSGLNIIMGSGWYVHPFHDSARLTATADELCEELLAEFANGVGDTGIKPGIIGEIGVSPLFTDAENIRLRAACRAQRHLGVPMFVHLPGWQRRALDVLDIAIAQEGVAPDAIVLCHMDPSGEDVGYQRAVAARGVWLEFDMIGMLSYYAGEGQSPAPEQTAIAIAGLVRDGHGERLLLSHDLSVKSMWTRNGGNGIGYVSRLFLPRLERHGVPASVTANLLTVNPRRLFEQANKQKD
jgi:phosphotriesterase-related protein